MISLCAFEDLEHIQDIMNDFENAMTNRSRILVHYSGKEEDSRSFLRGRSSVLVNPGKYPVKAFSGMLLHAHLSNFLYAKALMGDTPFYFLLAASNMRFLFCGFEDFVLEKQISIQFEKAISYEQMVSFSLSLYVCVSIPHG